MRDAKVDSFELWLRRGAALLCVVGFIGCSSIPREWPLPPPLLGQDKNVEKLVLERFKEGQSAKLGSIEDRVAIELLVQEFIIHRYAVTRVGEKVTIDTLQMACALSDECVVLLEVTIKRWGGFDTSKEYLVFEKSGVWSLRHSYPSGGVSLRY